MGTEKQKIVSDAGFIDSIRDLGLTTTDAVNELVDNSFDWGANNVWITIAKGDSGTPVLIVEDDGVGIPHVNLKKVLAFGGRDAQAAPTTGKFGWGLSSSACCQSVRTEVYSKVKGEKFYFNYIDLNELKTTSGYLPETIAKDPFSDYKHLNIGKTIESGTVIILKSLDRPEKRKINSLETLIHESLAIVQRKFLASGKNIFLNKKKIVFVDPLMLMDGADGLDKCSKGEAYGEIEPIVFPDILDENGKPAKVEILISKLPYKDIASKKLQHEYPYNINIATQGFYIVRHNRQIAGGQTLHLYTRHPMLNYFRAEISFKPCLDSKFGIQTNKSRFSLDDELRELLETRLNKVITQIRTDLKEEADALKAELQRNTDVGESLSEEIAGLAAKKMKPSGYKPTAEENKRAEADLKKEKEEKIKRINANKSLTQPEKNDLIGKIESAFQKEKTFHKVIDVIGTGEFYKIKHRGNKRIDVVINQAHGFYKMLYERATQDPRLQILLDLFLFTLAQAEDVYFDNKEVREFYNTQRREWSAIMSAFLDVAEEKLED